MEDGGLHGLLCLILQLRFPCSLLAAPKRGEDQRPSEVMKKKREDPLRVDEGKSTAAAAMCKKGDGKGWHCKRAAQSGYSLCPHHLDKLRSYSHSQTKKKEEEKKKKPKAPPAAGKPTAAGAHHQLGPSQQEKNGDKKRVEEHVLGTGPGAVSDSFYYYSGFGPWWGKRRRDGRSSVDAGKVHDGGASQAQLPQHTDDTAAAGGGVGGDGEGEEGEEGELHEGDSEGGRDGRPWKSRALSSLL